MIDFFIKVKQQESQNLPFKLFKPDKSSRIFSEKRSFVFC
jgi:hypothetical protein